MAQRLTLRETLAAKSPELTADDVNSEPNDDWWVSPEAFKSLGLAGMLNLSGVSYYGGWPGHQSAEGKSSLVMRVDQSGISLRRFKAIFTIPWSEISDIVVEGPDEAQRRFTATRLVLLGPLGLAFKKDRKGSKEAIITVKTRAGDEAIFNVAKTLPREIAPKLEPVAMQARRASKGDDRTDADRVPTAEGGPDLAEQIEKLADLKAKGILTDEEFAGKKTELLARM